MSVSSFVRVCAAVGFVAGLSLTSSASAQTVCGEGSYATVSGKCVAYGDKNRGPYAAIRPGQWRWPWETEPNWEPWEPEPNWEDILFGPPEPEPNWDDIFFGDGDGGSSYWISGGGLFTEKSSSYRSTGAQTPFDGRSTLGDGLLGAGVNVPVVGGPSNSLSVNFSAFFPLDGDHELAKKAEHGPGLVALREDDRVILEPVFQWNKRFGEREPMTPFGYADEPTRSDAKKNPLADGKQAYAAARPRSAAAPWVFSIGVGPSFRNSKFTMTSDQTFFGGPFISVSDDKWQTGIVVAAGISHAICANCLMGRPVSLGLDFRARWYGSQTVHANSPFGFTETGRVAPSTNQSVSLKLSAPLFGH